jgi:uncharacterized repeat protein (TIGR03803 family)
VPPAPASNDGQTVFFFPGLEDIDDVVSILQPVLAWNKDFSEAWSIASWNCCPNGIAVESSPVSVNPGDQIQGNIRSTCSVGTLSCPTWNVTTSDVLMDTSTELSNTPSGGQTFNWAFAGVLEVYNLVQCSDYPSNGSVTFSNVDLYDYNFDQIFNPDWSMIYVASGLTPQCSYGGQVAPTQVTLDYSSFTTLLSFISSDNGAAPIGPLVQGLDGNLYGTASAGGTNSEGTLFGVATRGTPTVLYSFSGIDGAGLSSILRLGPLRSSNLAPLLIDILRHLGRRAKLRPAQIQPVN